MPTAGNAWPGEPAEDADGFFELGSYEGGEQVVRPVPDDGEVLGWIWRSTSCSPV